MPLVARLDLPHKGIPYLHINIESEQGELSGLNHCLLSIKPYENNILNIKDSKSQLLSNYLSDNILSKSFLHAKILSVRHTVPSVFKPFFFIPHKKPL